MKKNDRFTRSLQRILKFADLGAPEALIDAECFLLLELIVARLKPRMRMHASVIYKNEIDKIEELKRPPT